MKKIKVTVFGHEGGQFPPWQPIATAPKTDGAKILGVRNGHVFSLYWCAETQRWGGGPCWYNDVTHWMPLPDVPHE